MEMKKILLFILLAVLVIVIGFMANHIINQDKGYHAGLEAFQDHYEKTRYDAPLNDYLENHFANKKEFQFSKRVIPENPVEFRNSECFSYGLSKKLISGTWPKDDPPFCLSDFSFQCVREEGLNIEGIADEIKNDCINSIIIDCTCWY